MKVCKMCGIPDIVGRDQIWNRDGTISIAGDPRYRMGILEVDLFRNIVAGLEEVVGPAIHNMFMEGKRKNARHYIDSLLKGPLGFMVRHTKAGGKKAYIQLLDTSAALGYGKVELEVYTRKKRVGGTIYDPYYIPLFMGDVRGAFESIERLPSKGKWEGDYKSAKIMVEKAGDEDKLEERFLFEEKKRLPGEVRYTVCDGCGLPEKLVRFRWDVDKGTILDNRIDERIFMMGLNDINAVFGELESAIGDVVSNTVFSVNREHGLNLIKHECIRVYEDFVEDMLIKGMANASFNEKKKVVKFTFKNPFNRHYLVGRALGIFEGLEGMSGKADVKEKPAHLEVTLSEDKGRGGK